MKTPSIIKSIDTPKKEISSGINVRIKTPYNKFLNEKKEEIKDIKLNNTGVNNHKRTKSQSNLSSNFMKSVVPINKYKKIEEYKTIIDKNFNLNEVKKQTKQNNENNEILKKEQIKESRKFLNEYLSKRTKQQGNKFNNNNDNNFDE